MFLGLLVGVHSFLLHLNFSATAFATWNYCAIFKIQMTSIPNNKTASTFGKTRSHSYQRPRICNSFLLRPSYPKHFGPYVSVSVWRCIVCVVAFHALCLSHHINIDCSYIIINLIFQQMHAMECERIRCGCRNNCVQMLLWLFHSNRRCHSFHWISMNIPASCTTGHLKRNNVMFYDFCLSFLEHNFTLS